ncbi:6558_t:CDS:1, partial [Acaulospora colombiana]
EEIHNHSLTHAQEYERSVFESHLMVHEEQKQTDFPAGDVMMTSE